MNEITSPEVEELLKTAQAAYEAKDSKTVQDACNQVFLIEPENVVAWDLMAKYGAWDSKMFDLDVDEVLRYTNHALDLLDEEKRFEAATEIYVARKKQIADRLEGDMLMPSYMGAKKLHATMELWKRLLSEMPYLTSELIQSELVLCDNLCLRSRMAVMPGDRLIYVAYCQENKKKPYGETFREALASRLDAESQKNEQKRVAIAQDALKRLPESAARVEEYKASATPELEEQLREDFNWFQGAVTELEGLSNMNMYYAQVEELNKKLKELKVTKIFKRQDLNRKIQEHMAKIDAIYEELAPVTDPIEAQMAAIEGLIEV